MLVDHNKLQGVLGQVYGGRVGGVVDHHEDEGAVPEDAGDEPRRIEKAGSCTSLVTSSVREAWDALSASAMASGAAHAQGDGAVDDAAVAKMWDAQVAKLALASVLVDTRNLGDESKTTEWDVRAVEYLEAKIVGAPQMVAQGWDREKFYESIEEAKRDVGGLRLGEVLGKDYKEWEEGKGRLGISSVVKPIAFLRRKAGEETEGKGKDEAFVEGMRQFAEERELSIYTVMTTSTSEQGEFQRELLVWALKSEAVEAAKKFADEAAEELGLEEWQGEGNGLGEVRSDKEWRKVWRQRKVENSRKQVAPLLRKAMR